MRAMWSLHRFTRSRRTSDCALHTMMHEVPADNVMRHDTADFPPLLPMAAHSLTQSTHKSRSVAECPETSRRRCWKLSWVAGPAKMGRQSSRHRWVCGNLATPTGVSTVPLHVKCKWRVFTLPQIYMLPQTTPYPLGPDPRR